jgi:uncharacterized membrane protein YeiH
MYPETFQIPFALDLFAVFAWALSGAIVGMRKGFDVTGVFVVSLLSSLGGSLARDALFLQRKPPVLTEPTYLPIVLAATLIVFFIGRRLVGDRYRMPLDRTVAAIDSFGTPAFAVIGMQLAIAAAVPLPGVMLVGVANGIGGSLLRDIVVRDVPAILRPGQHFTTVLVVACAFFLVLTYYRLVSGNAAGLLTIALFVAIRIITVRYNLRTRPILPLQGSD